MATLSLCSAFTRKPSHAQIPTKLSICQLQRTNFSFVLSNSLPSLTLNSTKREEPTLSFVAKSTETEALETVDEAQVVEDSTETESAPVVETESAPVVETEEPKREEVFAVVMVGSRQYIVHPGRYIYTQRLKGANVNDKITLNKVLLVGTKTSAYIGRPIVPNALVQAVVEEQTLDKKVVVFKYKKKKNYRRNIGHRQPITRIRITSITGYQDSPVVTLP